MNPHGHQIFHHNKRCYRVGTEPVGYWPRLSHVGNHHACLVWEGHWDMGCSYDGTGVGVSILLWTRRTALIVTGPTPLHLLLFTKGTGGGCASIPRGPYSPGSFTSPRRRVCLKSRGSWWGSSKRNSLFPFSFLLVKWEMVEQREAEGNGENKGWQQWAGESGWVAFQQQEESDVRGLSLWFLWKRVHPWRRKSKQGFWSWNSKGEEWEQNCCLWKSSNKKKKKLRYRRVNDKVQLFPTPCPPLSPTTSIAESCRLRLRSSFPALFPSFPTWGQTPGRNKAEDSLVQKSISNVGRSNFCSLQAHSWRTVPVVGCLLIDAPQKNYLESSYEFDFIPSLSALFDSRDKCHFSQVPSLNRGFFFTKTFKGEVLRWCKQGTPWSFKRPQLYYLSILWDTLGHLVLYLKLKTKASKSYSPLFQTLHEFHLNGISRYILRESQFTKLVFLFTWRLNRSDNQRMLGYLDANGLI